jgi:hypothetical protein
MGKFNKGAIEFKFEFVGYDNRFMNVDVKCRDNVYIVTPDQNMIGTATVDIELPDQIILNFSGKDYNADTVVDADGKIVKDVYIRIMSISVDGSRLKDNFLYQKLHIVTDDDREFTTAYIGFNGQIIIDLPKTTIFSQYLSMNV